jgi:hypothetical protein
MNRSMVWFFLMGGLLVWSAVASAQPMGQPAAPPAAPPPTPAPAEQPAVQPPAPQAVQPVPPPGSPVMGRKGAGQHRFFNPDTVETLAGQVVRVQRGPLRKGGKGNFVRFTLQTDKGPLPVFLGPASYVDAQAVKLAAGDKVEVKGSRLTGPKGRTAITAVEVMKGGQVLKLRDDQGNPVWPRQQWERRRVPQAQ